MRTTNRSGLKREGGESVRKERRKSLKEGVCVLWALKSTVRASLAFILEKSHCFSTMTPLWPLESISPQICSRGVTGALSELGWLLSFRMGFLTDLTPHKAQNQAASTAPGREPSNLFPLPFLLLIAVLSSLKSVADENIILLSLCQPKTSIIQWKSQPSWFGAGR